MKETQQQQEPPQGETEKSLLSSIADLTMEEKQQPLSEIHIVMFPWMAHAHLLPFIELAKGLAAGSLKISFISTPLNILWIKHQLPQPQTVTGIDLLQLDLPPVEGLPPGVESTAHLTNGGTVELLMEALDRCEAPFEALLTRLSPDFVIHDCVQYWTPRVAGKLGIPSIFFSTVSAASINFWACREATADLKRPAMFGFPSAITPKFVPSFQTGEFSYADRLIMCADQSWANACNSCREIEGKYLDYWRLVSNRPVYPVGILMPQFGTPSDDPCLEWLDRQGTRSVVVAGFGGECELRSEEVVALALGLEESLMPFMLVLGNNGGAGLPLGFSERTHGRGFVVTRRVPQVHILRHPSTGVFITHCGWSSVLEGLMSGVPMVALPMQFEQALSARLMADELGVAVEVERNGEDGSFANEDVSKAVRGVMVEERGKCVRANVDRLSEELSRNDFEVNRSNMESFIGMLRREAIREHPS